MSIAFVVGVYTILTIVGLISAYLYFSRDKRSLRLSALHIIFTVAGFGVFTSFMVARVPGQSVSWPNISYMFFAVAGLTTILSVITSQLLSIKPPKWMPATFGLFEIAGYLTLLVSVAVHYK